MSNRELEFGPNNKPGLLYYTAEEIACVIAQGFLSCLPTPDRNHDLPATINCSKWLGGTDRIYQEKISKIIWYFQEYQREENENSVNKIKTLRRVSFERNYLPIDKYKSMNDTYFFKSNQSLSDIKIKSTGTVEEEDNAIIVDFANRYIGGGVMNKGYVQEEALFLDYPELLMGCVICAKMQDYEAITVVGPKLNVPFTDIGKLDKHGRIDRTFVAIDALYLGSMKDQVDQFFEKHVLRELKKAYIGFTGDSQNEEKKQNNKSVSTGRWGCGAFNGNSELKFLIQWIAASLHNRDIIFHTCDHEDGANLKQLGIIYIGQTVNDIYKDLVAFRKHLQKEKKMYITKSKMKHILYDFLKSIH